MSSDNTGSRRTSPRAWPQPGGSAIDARTQHVGYDISQRKRKRVEECFAWLKTTVLLRKVRHPRTRRRVSQPGTQAGRVFSSHKLARLREVLNRSFSFPNPAGEKFHTSDVSLSATLRNQRHGFIRVRAL